MKQSLLEKLKKAVEKDPDIICDRTSVEETLGSDANYLHDVLGLTKSDLIRLERLGFALKARYATQSKRKIAIKNSEGNIELKDVTGPHRVRWLIFKEALE